MGLGGFFCVDDTYQIYVNRVARLTLPDTYQSQLPLIQASPKFLGGQPQSFPGYSVITPPAQEDGLNASFYQSLTALQSQMAAEFTHWFCPVPPGSFHLTLADLVWDAQYRSAIAENPNFEEALQNCVAQSFAQYQPSWPPEATVQWQSLGLVVFPRALGVALVPRQEADYPPILQLRRSLYQNPQLIALGIEQQYHYTAHVTLGYFGEIPPNLSFSAIGEQLCHWNDQSLAQGPQILRIPQVELRYFADMTQFSRQSHYPVLHLKGR